MTTTPCRHHPRDAGPAYPAGRRPPLLRRILIAPAVVPIRIYQALVAPLLPPLCRFEPTCSHYAIDALRERGLVVGGILAAWRILRCNPFSRGGYDPVPPRRRRAAPRGKLEDGTPVSSATRG